MPGETISEPQGPLGTSLADLEARIAALEKNPQWWPGMIAWTAAGSAPQGFLIADGSTYDVDRYAALFAVLGVNTLPNLIDRFPVGAGGLYALLTTGGAASVTLTGAQSGVPAHTHPAGVTGGPSVASTGAGTAHSHGAPTGGQSFVQTSGGGGGLATGAANFNTGANTATESAHTHSMQSHTHTTSTSANSAANAASSHSVLNPYVALTPLVHI